MSPLSPRKRLALSALSGIACALAYPSPGLWLLAFVAWVPLLAAVRGVDSRAAAGYGLVAGFVFFAAVLRWLSPLSVLGWAVLSGYLALYVAAFAAAAAMLLTRPGTIAKAAIPALWVALEWARSWLFSGFGWAALGMALAPEPAAIQAAAIGGVWLLSLVVMGCNVALAQSLWLAWDPGRSGHGRQRWRAAGLALAWALALPALLMTYGAFSLAAAPETADASADAGSNAGSNTSTAAASVTVAAIQGDIAPHSKWHSDGLYHSLSRYQGLSSLATTPIAQKHNKHGKGHGRPDLLVWPETAIPAAIHDPGGPSLHARGLQRFVREVWQTPILFGLPESIPAQPAAVSANNNEALYWNSAIVYHPDRPPVRYRKRRLVPFGEYIPRDITALWPDMGRVIGGPAFVPGSGSAQALPIPLHDAADGASDVRDQIDVGVLICFESIFADEAVQRAQSANLLAIITNDAWFSFSGRMQHMHIAIIRAVEAGRSVVRAANTGISALIDPQGRVRAQAVSGPAAIVGRLPLSREQTPFSAMPDCLPLLALIFALWALVPSGSLIPRGPSYQSPHRAHLAGHEL